MVAKIATTNVILFAVILSHPGFAVDDDLVQPSPPESPEGA